MKPRICCAQALSSLQRNLPLQQSINRPQLYPPSSSTKYLQPVFHRSFTATPRTNSWLIPKKNHTEKNRKGRCRVPTGGSTRGTTVVWGDYGLRLRDHDRRLSAKHLQIGADTIKGRLRGERYRFYTRVAANIGVYTSGNETRMGKGKGTFDHWAARVAVSQIIFEIKGTMHEQVARDAMRLAGNKLPGQWEFVKKGDPPVMGLTPLHPGVTLATLRKPRRPLPGDITASRIPSTIPGPLPNLPSSTSASTGSSSATL